MNIKILKESKDEMEIEVESLTLVELLRVYLNKDTNVTFAAWRRDHPSKNPILKVDAKDVKKAMNSAIENAIKDLDKIHTEFKPLK